MFVRPAIEKIVRQRKKTASDIIGLKKKINDLLLVKTTAK